MSSIFCRSTLRQATLAHLFAGAVKAGAPEAFPAPAKMEGGKAAGRNAPRGAQPTAGGRSPATAPRTPGAPSGGGRGGGEAGENPQGSTAAPREGQKETEGGRKAQNKAASRPPQRPPKGSLPPHKRAGGFQRKASAQRAGQASPQAEGKACLPCYNASRPKPSRNRWIERQRLLAAWLGPLGGRPGRGRRARPAPGPQAGLRKKAGREMAKRSPAEQAGAPAGCRAYRWGLGRAQRWLGAWPPCCRMRQRSKAARSQGQAGAQPPLPPGGRLPPHLGGLAGGRSPPERAGLSQRS